MAPLAPTAALVCRVLSLQEPDLRFQQRRLRIGRAWLAARCGRQRGELFLQAADLALNVPGGGKVRVSGVHSTLLDVGAAYVLATLAATCGLVEVAVTV